AARGILFDQAHVVAGADSVLAAAGVADRCEIVAGSFFENVPTGGDAYVLKSIIHDWEDEESVAILRGCRASMGPAAVVLLIERDLGGPNENPAAKLSDLNMLVMPGGLERSEDEYAVLFEQAGHGDGACRDRVGPGVNSRTARGRQLHEELLDRELGSP